MAPILYEFFKSLLCIGPARYIFLSILKSVRILKFGIKVEKYIYFKKYLIYLYEDPHRCADIRTLHLKW